MPPSLRWELIAQKEALGHGNFLPWIGAEFRMSEDSAQRLMSMARYVDENTEHVRYLEGMSARAIAALAAPSTPTEVREEVLERAAGLREAHSK